MNIPEGTTHIWTPGFFKPYVGFGVSRRFAYKRSKGIWYSFTNFGEWVKSCNGPEWFAEEKKLGYFVTVNRFNSPGFIPVKEVV